MAKETIDEERALAEIVERLEDRFPKKTTHEITVAVTSAHAHFARAKVRDFVPVLVEREAKARLERPV